MNLQQRYRKLNLWNKLAVWGAMASILGLTIALFQSMLGGRLRIPREEALHSETALSPPEEFYPENESEKSIPSTSHNDPRIFPPWTHERTSIIEEASPKELRRHLLQEVLGANKGLRGVAPELGREIIAKLEEQEILCIERSGWAFLSTNESSEFAGGFLFIKAINLTRAAVDLSVSSLAGESVELLDVAVGGSRYFAYGGTMYVLTVTEILTFPLVDYPLRVSIIVSNVCEVNQRWH